MVTFIDWEKKCAEWVVERMKPHEGACGMVKEALRHQLRFEWMASFLHSGEVAELQQERERKED